VSEERRDYRVIISIPEDEEWEEQELIDGQIFNHVDDAKERASQIDLGRYSEGTRTYIEYLPRSAWRRL
jgi:hypothetical protein